MQVNSFSSCNFPILYDCLHKSHLYLSFEMPKCKHSGCDNINPCPVINRSDLFFLGHIKFQIHFSWWIRTLSGQRVDDSPANCGFSNSASLGKPFDHSPKRHFILFSLRRQIERGRRVGQQPFPWGLQLELFIMPQGKFSQSYFVNVAFFSDFFQVVRYHMSLVETAEIVFHATPELTSCVPRTGEALLLSVEEFWGYESRLHRSLNSRFDTALNRWAFADWLRGLSTSYLSNNLGFVRHFIFWLPEMPLSSLLS